MTDILVVGKEKVGVTLDRAGRISKVDVGGTVAVGGDGLISGVWLMLTEQAEMVTLKNSSQEKKPILPMKKL